MTERKTMDVKEMGKVLGISVPKAYDLAKQDGFQAIQLGRRIVIPVDAFYRWMDEQA